MKKPNQKQHIKKFKKTPKNNISFSYEYKITKSSETKLKLISWNGF